MLLKAYSTWHSRMSSSRWVIMPLWLSGSLRYFLYSSLYSCYFFLTSSAYNRSLLFLSFFIPVLAWDVPLVSLIFLKRPLVFPILLFSSISLHCLLKEAFLSLLAILWYSAFSRLYLSLYPLPFPSVLSSAICKDLSDNHFDFLHLFYFGMVLVGASCTVLQTSIRSSSGTLSTKSDPLNVSLTSTV